MAKGKSGAKGGVAALDQSPSHLLHRAVQLALDLYAEEFGPAALTQRQYAVLAAVADHEGATQTDLVRITGIDRSTLADMAGRMIAKGLLERQRSSLDARANAVTLSEAGRAALADAGPRMAAVDARLLKRLSSGKRDAFLTQLRGLLKPAQDGAPKAKKRKADKPPKDETRKRKKARKLEAA